MLFSPTFFLQTNIVSAHNHKFPFLDNRLLLSLIRFPMLMMLQKTGFIKIAAHFRDSALQACAYFLEIYMNVNVFLKPRRTFLCDCLGQCISSQTAILQMLLKSQSNLLCKYCKPGPLTIFKFCSMLCSISRLGKICHRDAVPMLAWLATYCYNIYHFICVSPSDVIFHTFSQ